MNQVKNKEVQKLAKDIREALESCIDHKNGYYDNYYGDKYYDLYNTEEALYKVIEVLKKYNVIL